MMADAATTLVFIVCPSVIQDMKQRFCTQVEAMFRRFERVQGAAKLATTVTYADWEPGVAFVDHPRVSWAAKVPEWTTS
jgi:hypothetical protein